MRWLLIVLLSAALGVGAAASDVLAGDRHAPGHWQALAVVLNAGAVWAGLAVVCGVLARRVLAAGLAAVAGLAIAVLGYYGYAVLLGDRMDLGFSAVRGSVEYWLIAALVLGPLLGIVGALARRPDAVGLLAGWVLPAGIALEVVGLRRFTPADLLADRGPAAGEIGLLILGATLALVVLLRWLVAGLTGAQPSAARTASATRSAPTEPITSV